MATVSGKGTFILQNWDDNDDVGDKAMTPRLTCRIKINGKMIG